MSLAPEVPVREVLPGENPEVSKTLKDACYDMAPEFLPGPGEAGAIVWQPSFFDRVADEAKRDAEREVRYEVDDAVEDAIDIIIEGR